MSEIKPMLLEHNFDESIIDQTISAKRYTRLLSKTRHNGVKDLNIDMDLCEKMYLDYHIPIFRIAMLYGISDGTMRELFISHNIVLKGHCCGKNSQNNYFENIDSSDKAYFLGLLAADGSVVKNKKHSTVVRLELIETDSYILEKFNEYGNFNEKIYLDNRLSSSNGYTYIKNTKWIGINSSKMAQDLAKYGIVQNKSVLDTIYLPNFEDNSLTLHFIRGFYDGDGIAFKDGRIGFCGSKTIIENIHDYFINKYNFNKTMMTYNKSNNIYYIQWGSKKDVKLFYDLMYSNTNDLFLIRKKEKIENRFSSVA